MNNQLVNKLPAFENPFYPKEPDNYPNIRCIWIRADGIEFYMKVKPAKHDISSADSQTSSSHPKRVSSTGRPADILDELSTRSRSQTFQNDPIYLPTGNGSSVR